MIEAWFDEDADDPVVVETSADLDAVLDAVAAIDGPTIVNLHIDGEYPWLETGLDGDKGTLRYVGDDAPDGAFSRNPGEPFPLPEWGEVRYYYMRNERPYPDNAEIPVAAVRAAAHEFLASAGARPANVEWTDEQAPPTS